MRPTHWLPVLKNTQAFVLNLHVAAIHYIIELDDVLVKAATSLCGGTAEQFLGTCGTLSGGIMVLVYFFGRAVDSISYKKVAIEITRDQEP